MQRQTSIRHPTSLSSSNPSSQLASQFPESKGEIPSSLAGQHSPVASRNTTPRLRHRTERLVGTSTVAMVAATVTPWRSVSVLCLLAAVTHGAEIVQAVASAPPALSLDLRTRALSTDTPGQLHWRQRHAVASWRANETALVIVDVWDRHWCSILQERIGPIAVAINATADAARRLGVTVIHAPSECMGFYSSYAQRKAVLALPDVPLPTSVPHDDPPYPLTTAANGGNHSDCDVVAGVPPSVRQTRPSQARATAPWPWTRQNPLVRIAPEDLISAGPDPTPREPRPGPPRYASGQELANIVAHRGIRHILYAGVHANFCIMDRPFAIKQATKWGMDVALLRDLTDVQYSPANPPYVSHDEGLGLMVRFIEQHWAPTAQSYNVVYSAAGAGDM